MGCIDELTPNQTTLMYPDSNLTLWGPDWTFNAKEESEESCGANCQKGIGIAMVLVGEVGILALVRQPSLQWKYFSFSTASSLCTNRNT